MSGDDSFAQLDPSRCRLLLPLDPAAVEAGVEQRLAALRPRASAPGFRPGKAPLAVLRRRYGSQLRDEQWRRAAHAALRTELARRGLVAALPPVLSTTPQPDEVEATVEVFPELPSFDLAALVVRRPVVEVQAEDVEALAQRLRPAGAPEPPGWREELAASMRAELPAALGDEAADVVVTALFAAAGELPLPAGLVEAQVAALRGGPGGVAAAGEELAAKARRLLGETLVLAAAARAAGLAADPAALYAETARLAAAAPDPAAELDRIWADAAWVQEIEDGLLKRRVAAAVLARARVEDEPLRFAELVARRRARAAS